jgi:hypothetical protein
MIGAMPERFARQLVKKLFITKKYPFLSNLGKEIVAAKGISRAHYLASY